MSRRTKTPKKNGRASSEAAQLQVRTQEARERRLQAKEQARMAKRRAKEARKLLKEARKVAKRAKAELAVLSKRLKALMAEGPKSADQRATKARARQRQTPARS